MKHFLFLFLFSTTLVSCDKDDNTSHAPLTPTNSYGYAITDEGTNFIMTDAEGNVHDVGAIEVDGWDSGQLLNYNYWIGFHTPIENEGYLYVRYNFPEEMDWQVEMEGESPLYNQTLLLQWTADLETHIVEVYVGGSDNMTGRASGTITVELDVENAYGHYDLVGHLDATFYNDLGEPITLNGNFWKKEM